MQIILLVLQQECRALFLKQCRNDFKSYNRDWGKGILLENLVSIQGFICNG